MLRIPVGEPEFESAGWGGRTFIRTVRTLNALPRGSTWNFTLEGSVRVVEGATWLVAPVEEGAVVGGESGLRVISVSPLRVDRFGIDQGDVLSWMRVIVDGKIRHVGQSVVLGKQYHLNTREADYVALPYVTTHADIPWRIEVKNLPVPPAPPLK